MVHFCKNIARGTTDPGYWVRNFVLKTNFPPKNWKRAFSYDVFPYALFPQIFQWLKILYPELWRVAGPLIGYWALVALQSKP